MKKILALFSLLAAGIMTLSFAGCVEEQEAPGKYSVDASLSCYIAAMCGIEFGSPMLESTSYTLNEDGSMKLTLSLVKSSVTIYSITCYTFVDPAPDSGETPEEGQPENGTIGYYDKDGNLVTEGVSYTLSDDTAPNPAGEEVHYVDSITFPVEEKTDTYSLTLFINSNVMGTQFSNSGYAATLTVDWDSMQEAAA